MKRRSTAVDNTVRAGAMRAAMPADQAEPVRRPSKGAKRSAAGMGFEPIPWRASEARRRQRWKPKGRDAMGGSMRSTRARPGIDGDARMLSMLVRRHGDS
jgi:hypothetical protein